MMPHATARSVAVVVVALVALLASRVPFVLDNPDWGPVIDSVHCGVLSTPRIRGHLEACSGGDVALSIVDRSQMESHYHLGSRYLYSMVALLYEWTGTRSLALLKGIGTGLTAIYIVAMAWALTQLFHRRWLPVLVPLFLIVVPPGAFLWLSLLPRGHYFEHHFFYALFLPFMLAGARGLLGPRILVAMGGIGGFAAAYTISNALFPAAILGWYILDTLRRPGHLAAKVRRACLGTGLALGAAALTFLPFARIGAILARLRVGLSTEAAAPQVAAPVSPAPDTSWVDNALGIWSGHQTFVCTPFLHSLELGGPAGGTWTSCGLAAVFGVGALLLIAAVFRRPAAATHEDHVRRFLALNGVLLLGSLAAYVLLGPAWSANAGRENSYLYLTPIYPPLFLGAGAVFATGALSSTPIRRALAVLLALALAVPLLAGWHENYQYNSAPRYRPDYTHCDGRQLSAYFIDVEPGAGPADRDAGRRCCESSQPGCEERCALAHYLVRLSRAEEGSVGAAEGVDAFDCARTPPEDRRACARAYGALLGSCDDGAFELGSNDHLCSIFTGDAFDSCVSGAFQGSFYRSEPFGCVGKLLSLCDTGFEQPEQYAACAEQVGALVQGMPELPSGETATRGVCETWPEAFQGLCHRAEALTDEPCEGSNEPCCEDVYQDRFRAEVPLSGSLYYASCLDALPDVYPYCAIGVARLLGETDCRWSRDPMNYTWIDELGRFAGW